MPVSQVRQLQSHLKTLSMQIAGGEKLAGLPEALPGGSHGLHTRHQRFLAKALKGSKLRTPALPEGAWGPTGAGPEDAACCLASVDVDSLPEQDLRRELKKVCTRSSQPGRACQALPACRVCGR